MRLVSIFYFILASINLTTQRENPPIKRREVNTKWTPEDIPFDSENLILYELRHEGLIPASPPPPLRIGDFIAGLGLAALGVGS